MIYSNFTSIKLIKSLLFILSTVIYIYSSNYFILNNTSVHTKFRIVYFISIFILNILFFAAFLSFLFALNIYLNYYQRNIIYTLFIFTFVFSIILILLSLDKPKLANTTLGDVYNHKNNSFTLLRFIFASVVMVFHCYFKSGVIAKPFLRITQQFDVAALSVFAFMAISGFFMIQSLINSKTYIHFFIKRFLRIYPLFITASILVILFSHATSYEKFSLTLNKLFLDLLTIPITKSNLPIQASLSPTWTIKIEFMIYILLVIFYFISNKNRQLLFFFTSIFIVNNFILVSTYKVGHNNDILLFLFQYTISNYNFLGFMSVFLVSSLLYLYKDYIPCNKYILFFLIALSYIIFKLNIFVISTIFACIILPYIIILIGSLYKIKLWTKYGDYSYGMYVIHFIIYTALNFKSNIHNTIIIFMLSLALSIFSWHLLEKPFIMLKNKL